ncbi:hypothetical protein [Allorhizobium undicola]|uniref:hypothetical protein n=1 Tax=Allorhizobium undicola TaxID=78527 RepID=UPI0012B52C01|nr:hypothetical protein [Allorhizobium undicola]
MEKSISSKSGPGFFVRECVAQRKLLPPSGAGWAIKGIPAQAVRVLGKTGLFSLGTGRPDGGSAARCRVRRLLLSHPHISTLRLIKAEHFKGLQRGRNTNAELGLH